MIEPPPENVSREALAAALFILVATLRLFQEKFPEDPFALMILGSIRGVRTNAPESEMLRPMLDQVGDDELQQLQDYLADLYDNPGLGLLVSETAGTQ